MRTHRFAAALLCATAIAVPSVAIASPITYHFSGSFEQQFGLAPAGMTGTAFSGTLVYDPASPISSSTANSIVYGPGSASLSLDTVFGSGAIDAGTGQVASRWDGSIASQLGGLISPADEMAVGGAATYSGSLALFHLLSMQLLDGTGGAADDPFGAPGSQLPPALDLGQIDSASVTLFAAGTVGGVFQTIASAVGRIDCLSTNATDCATVPEPPSIALLIASLLLLAASGRVAATRAVHRPTDPNGPGTPIRKAGQTAVP